ncbi:HD domain-containing protein [Lentisphaerota bacterium WC36G]|nr:HD domain-containing protein [Lentisphaerae bacterium WC36]
MYQEALKKLQKNVEEHLSTAPVCHDFSHVLRVLQNAKLIGEAEAKKTTVDMNVVVMAALLHDIARPEEIASKGKVCHAAAGAAQVPTYLNLCGITDSKLIMQVSNCVLKHRFRNGITPSTIEEKIIYDADKLDAIGAIGIGRAFHFAGRIGARVHNSKEEAMNSDAYSIEDSAYREYLVKLRYIADKTLTETGTKIAIQRVKFMEDFFAQLNNEVF